ncbi:MAG TPA: hypothetical protein VN207_08815 [Ktedonobacteraceae bacterium]|nr:hypothetical protein [Ktedonobacteraceae bacterium]
MDDHFHMSSSGIERGHVKQQVRSDDAYYSTMGTISGGIMRFNLSGYDQAPNVDDIGVQPKKDSHRVPKKKHGGQVASDVKGASSSHTK